MARNGSGTYNRAVAPYVAGTTITAATVNSEMDDIATALTESMARNGEAPATANIPMGGFRLTGLGNAIANTDAAALGQVTSYALAKAGDTATGALGVIAGTAAAPGVFVSGDTNTGLFQPAADTLAVSIGGVEVARFGADGFVRLANGTAAAPAFSFSGDTNTGIFSPAADQLAVSVGGNNTFEIRNSTTILQNTPGVANSANWIGFVDASATVGRAGEFGVLNEIGIPLAGYYANVATDGSGNLELYATPAGARTSNRRLLRMTVPGSGAITMDGGLNVAGGLQFDGKLVGINRGTEQATTSGVSIDFTGIPAGVRRVTVLFDRVSTNGTSPIMVQLGISTGIEATGYTVGGTRAGSSNFAAHGAYTTGFAFGDSSGTGASQLFTGRLQLDLFNVTNNSFVGNGFISSDTAGGYALFTSGRKALAGVLDRLRITTVNGTDTFDNGAAIIMWEF